VGVFHSQPGLGDNCKLIKDGTLSRVAITTAGFKPVPSCAETCTSVLYKKLASTRGIGLASLTNTPVVEALMLRAMPSSKPPPEAES